MNEMNFSARTVPSMAAIDPVMWDTLANPADTPTNPFVTHTFLNILEESGSVGADAGWAPHHILLERDDKTVAACPAYLKGHSQGEYVFDYGWAEAFERAGGQYYPKLQISVPFTPVTGPRLLLGPGENRDLHRTALASAIAQVTDQNELSSAHLTFLPQDDWKSLGELGYLKRTDQQFHWFNRGYETFDEFLTALSSAKRKALRRERVRAVENDIEIKWIAGKDATEAVWDAFWVFYQDTGARKWGHPYLTREFFSLLGERMADELLLIFACREGVPIAGALNLVGGDTIYGRYWGCTEHHKFLHFEVCYYQAIDYAIAHGLKTVEAGAQGGHKLVRGYEPVTTYSAHWISDPNFRAAVENYLEQERRHVADDQEHLKQHLPFRKD